MQYLKNLLLTKYNIDSLINWFSGKNFVSVHAGTLYVTIWMTYLAFDWAGRFAFATDKPGVEVAAIITAVTVPVTALQGFIFSVYSKARCLDKVK